MKIHETSTAAVFLHSEGDALVLVSSDGKRALPDGALDAVMKRYGLPLEDGVNLTEVDALDVGDGTRLRHVRHLARFDVIAKDWLVYEREGAEPLCALATTVAGALDYLAKVPLEGS